MLTGLTGGCKTVPVHGYPVGRRRKNALCWNPFWTVLQHLRELFRRTPAWTTCARVTVVVQESHDLAHPWMND